MSLLRKFRLSTHNLSTSSRKSKTPEIESGDENGKTRTIERSDTFTIKALSPDKEIQEHHINFNTFTRKKPPENDKIRCDVFDAFYIRKSIERNDSDNEHDYDRHDHPHHEHQDHEHKLSFFDSSTYRKGKVNRNGTFIKKSSPARHYLFGQKDINNGNLHHDNSSYIQDDDIDYENQNKVNSVMTWFVDINNSENKGSNSSRNSNKKSLHLIEFPNENYRESSKLKRKTSIKSNGVKRTDTFKVNESNETEINHTSPIRIEIRNPPLSERNRENEIQRPVGVAMPYCSVKRGTNENKVSKTMITTSDQHITVPRSITKRNDIISKKNNYDTYSKSKANSMKSKINISKNNSNNNNNYKDKNMMRSSQHYQNVDDTSDLDLYHDHFNKVQKFWSKRESSTPPSLPPRPKKDSNDLLSKYHNLRKEEQRTHSMYKKNLNNQNNRIQLKQRDYDNNNDDDDDYEHHKRTMHHLTPTTNSLKSSSSKPKKLQQFWSSLNSRVNPKRHNNNDLNNYQSRYTYMSQEILKEQQRESKENEKLQKQKQQQIQRKSNPTSSTLSWLMKVKSKKN